MTSIDSSPSVSPWDGEPFYLLDMVFGLLFVVQQASSQGQLVGILYYAPSFGCIILTPMSRPEMGYLCGPGLRLVAVQVAPIRCHVKLRILALGLCPISDMDLSIKPSRPDVHFNRISFLLGR